MNRRTFLALPLYAPVAVALGTDAKTNEVFPAGTEPIQHVCHPEEAWSTDYQVSRFSLPARLVDCQAGVDYVAVRDERDLK